MKLTKKQFKRILKEYLEGENNIQLSKDMFLYSYAPREHAESILFNGLAGSKGIIQNEAILDELFYDQKAKQAFIDRYDPNDMTLQGPSVFFQLPEESSILEIDPEHHLGTKPYVLIEIDFNSLNDEPGYLGIYGVELVPYENENYERFKADIEHNLTAKEIRHYASLTFDEAWANYSNGYFAANVPHGIVLTKSGVIDPRNLRIID